MMTPEQQQEFLGLIPSVALYEEFKRRFDHCIIGGLMNRPTDEDPMYYVMAFSYSGSPLICQGLASQIAARCSADVAKNSGELGIDEL